MAISDSDLTKSIKNILTVYNEKEKKYFNRKLLTFSVGSNSSLSSYWFPAWKLKTPLPNSKYITYNIKISNGYGSYYGDLSFTIYKVNSNYGIYFFILSGNIEAGRYRLYYDTANENFELWINTQSRYMFVNGTVESIWQQDKNYDYDPYGEFITKDYTSLQTPTISRYFNPNYKFMESRALRTVNTVEPTNANSVFSNMYTRKFEVDSVTDSMTSNKPSSNGCLLTYKYTSNYGIQMYLGGFSHDYRPSIRQYNADNGGWTNYREFAFVDDIPGVLKNPNSLVINDETSSTTFEYDGSEQKEIRIPPNRITFNAGSDTANLSSYWFPIWKLTNPIPINGELTYTLEIEQGYNTRYGSMAFRIRNNGNNNYNIELYIISGNLNKDHFRLYHDVTNGQFELWGNCASRFSHINGIVTNICGRKTIHNKDNYGEFINQTFTEVQVPTLTNYMNPSYQRMYSRTLWNTNSGSRPSSANNIITEMSNSKVRVDLATTTMTEGNPGNSGYITTYTWDNNVWAAQFFISHAENVRPSIRISAPSTGWSSWKELAWYSDIPTSLKNPYALTINDNGSTKTYDGSEALTINIPTELKNPNALTFEFADGSSKTYDGSEPLSIYVSENSGISSEPTTHLYLHRVQAQLDVYILYINAYLPVSTVFTDIISFLQAIGSSSDFYMSCTGTDWEQQTKTIVAIGGYNAGTEPSIKIVYNDETVFTIDSQAFIDHTLTDLVTQII